VQRSRLVEDTVEDTDVEGSGVEIDAAVELMLLGVESLRSPPLGLDATTQHTIPHAEEGASMSNKGMHATAYGLRTFGALASSRT